MARRSELSSAQLVVVPVARGVFAHAKIYTGSFFPFVSVPCVCVSVSLMEDVDVGGCSTAHGDNSGTVYTSI